MEELDKILHQPVRTRITAYLATRGQATFSDLKRELEITDGNLEAHMKKLVAARYVEIEKQEIDNRTQTLYALSKFGEERFRKYVDTLQSVLLGMPKN